MYVRYSGCSCSCQGCGSSTLSPIRRDEYIREIDPRSSWYHSQTGSRGVQRVQKSLRRMRCLYQGDRCGDPTRVNRPTARSPRVCRDHRPGADDQFLSTPATSERSDDDGDSVLGSSTRGSWPPEDGFSLIAKSRNIGSSGTDRTR